MGGVFGGETVMRLGFLPFFRIMIEPAQVEVRVRHFRVEFQRLSISLLGVLF